jgi:ABC-type Na+ efflux pump permease subunit
MTPAARTSAVVAPVTEARTSLKRWILAGEVPILAVLIVSVAVFYGGRSTVQPRDKVAVVEKGAIVLEAVLSRPGASPEEIDAQVKQPILGVLQKYLAKGYTVIDVSKDDAGNMAVAAVPGDALDITGEMRQAVHLEAVPAALPATNSLSPAVLPASGAIGTGHPNEQGPHG